MILIHDCDYRRLVLPGLILMTLFAIVSDAARTIRDEGAYPRKASRTAATDVEAVPAVDDRQQLRVQADGPATAAGQPEATFPGDDLKPEGQP